MYRTQRLRPPRYLTSAFPAVFLCVCVCVCVCTQTWCARACVCVYLSVWMAAINVSSDQMDRRPNSESAPVAPVALRASRRRRRIYAVRCRPSGAHDTHIFQLSPPRSCPEGYLARHESHLLIVVYFRRNVPAALARIMLIGLTWPFRRCFFLHTKLNKPILFFTK